MRAGSHAADAYGGLDPILENIIQTGEPPKTYHAQIIKRDMQTVQYEVFSQVAREKWARRLEKALDAIFTHAENQEQEERSKARREKREVDASKIAGVVLAESSRNWKPLMDAFSMWIGVSEPKNVPASRKANVTNIEVLNTAGMGSAVRITEGERTAPASEPAKQPVILEIE